MVCFDIVLALMNMYFLYLIFDYSHGVLLTFLLILKF